MNKLVAITATKYFKMLIFLTFFLSFLNGFFEMSIWNIKCPFQSLKAFFASRTVRKREMYIAPKQREQIVFHTLAFLLAYFKVKL